MEFALPSDLVSKTLRNWTAPTTPAPCLILAFRGEQVRVVRVAVLCNLVNHFLSRRNRCVFGCNVGGVDDRACFRRELFDSFVGKLTFGELSSEPEYFEQLHRLVNGSVV